MDDALARKLLLKPDQKVLVVNAPAGYLERITPLPAGSSFVEAGPADWVQVFVRNGAEVVSLAAPAITSVTASGTLWLCYPKGGPKVTDINRDKGWDAVIAAGWGPVTQIAIDETWSALRFRPEADVKRKGKTP